MKKEYVEVLTDFTDENNYTHIDAYTTADTDDEPGQTVAIVCRDTRKVYYIDKTAYYSDIVKEAIADVLKELEPPKEYHFLVRDLDGENNYTFIIHCDPFRFIDTLQTALKQELDAEEVYFPEILPEVTAQPIDLIVSYDNENERSFEVMKLYCYNTP